MRNPSMKQASAAVALCLLSALAVAQRDTRTAAPGVFPPTPDGDPVINKVAPATPPASASSGTSGAAPAPSSGILAAAPVTAPAAGTTSAVVAANAAPPGTTVIPLNAASALQASAIAAAPGQREEETRVADNALDRAEREHERAAERARDQPAPINGAFTGLTNERDR